MGYIIPSLKELPSPTLEEFSKSPEFYWRQLEEYGNTPYIYRHLGLAGIRKRILQLISKYSH